MKYFSLILASLFIIGGCADELGGSSGPNAPPTLQFDENRVTSVMQSQSQDVTWRYSAADPDDVAAISFFYDDDDKDLDGTFIVGKQDNDGVSTLTYNWSPRTVPDGLYFIYGIIDDGNNPPVSVYKRFPIIIFSGSDAPPYVRLQTPVGPQQDYVLIPFVLWEASGGFYNLHGEYRGESVTNWVPGATLSKSINIPGGPENTGWASGIDVPTASGSNYQIRIWAENGIVTGPPHESGTFTLNN